jgi:hypothetical protein
MLDVHPPEHAAHTWRDFFIHIATICVGLLIAIGLEQSVEAIHRHHEREELIAALNQESQQILRDTERVENGTSGDVHSIQNFEAQVSDAARTRHPLEASTPHHKGSDWDVPDDPIYNAAKASTRTALLSDQEIVDYGEIDGLIQKVDSSYARLGDARLSLNSFTRELNFAKVPGTSPFANATPEQLEQLDAHLAQLAVALQEMRYWSRQTRGAVTAILQGERNLRNIETAERQFDKLP